MAHVSEKRWAEVSGLISAITTQMVQILNISEETYFQLLEVYAYTGNDDTEFAKLLFQVDIPTVEQLVMVADAKNALLACNDLTRSANNEAVGASDRIKAMRKMI